MSKILVLSCVLNSCKTFWLFGLFILRICHYCQLSCIYISHVLVLVYDTWTLKKHYSYGAPFIGEKLTI